ncbi:MurR/RpiR family transcriptional regulator [Paenibacillus sp. JNUCC31]|uniref:MurR/RpiR family transcriptional regulator n=1 Tax=Paenibacillus sp. JNUCC-31 TaxID=2777983 RepID=UPI0017808365|nr:MurR/RpiR family transcriptional regulator [Paenibacillus sp. JNUCC-31]QOS78994.1 MurR/RpiR family transcriptional regulator [Paenibacillus sp. JNUCC-31]
MKILTQLSDMHNFTPNEKSIASYILTHKEHILHLNIQELAKVTYTSHSAINRLTRKLGLSGFKEFIISLAREFQQSTQNISNVDPNYPFSLNESSLQVAKEIAELMKETIQKNVAFMDDKLLTQTSHLLNQAERIFIYAQGDSEIRAKSFQNKLFKINKYVVIATELSEWAHHTVNLTPRDCAIFLTYHGKSKDYIRAAQYFKSENIPFITITATSQSQLASISTICIQVPNDEVKYAKIGTFSSQIAFEYVLNVIYSCIYKIDYLNNKQNTTKSYMKFYDDE